MVNLITRIQQGWAAYFKCDIADLKQAGTSIIVNNNQHGTNRIDVWVIEKHAFLRIDPALKAFVKAGLSNRLDTTCFTANDLLSEWEGLAEHDDTVDICYLSPEEFQAVDTTSSFSRRQMALADKPYLDTLKVACTKAELEAADIDIDNDLVFGCFQGEQLVAVASMYTVWESFADIGVLAHPAFRGRQLGAAVTAAISGYLLNEGDHVVMYRYDVTNVGSAGVARKVGFRQYCQQVAIKLKT